MELEEKKVSLLQKLQGLGKPFDNIKQYCKLNGSELIKKIHLGEIEPVDILEAYQANALIKNNEFHFLSDIVYDADVSALLINKSEQKNLLGYPLSVSDAFLIYKHDCTQGLKSKIFKPSSKTSTIIQALKAEGAISFLITNVSQGLMKMESSNPIFGTTLNPFNKKLTCGGSSGGEAVAIATESSLIGLGIDIHGGIRIPAYYCGVFGLKPTSMRISSRHSGKMFFPGLILRPSIGTMSRNIDDLINTFKAMTSERIFDMDAYNPPIPFNERLFLSKSKMTIGYYTYIGSHQARPIPSVERAIMLAKQALENAGHEVVEFIFPNIDDLFILIKKVFNVDGFEKIFKDGLKDGPVDPSLLFNLRIFKTPRYIIYLMYYFCGLFSKRLSQSIIDSIGLSVFETSELYDKVMTYREEVLTMLEKKGLDGLICPVLPIVAPPINSCNGLADVYIYSSVYNMLDYPAGTVPVTKVSKEDVENMNKTYGKISKINKKIIQYQKEILGLPVGVQCVSKPWRDEICLRIMKDIVSNL